MKHIEINSISDVAASSENANFLAEKLLDGHPKRPYKAADGITQTTITANVVGGVSDIMVAGTNADAAIVTATDPNLIEWGGTDVWGGNDFTTVAAYESRVAGSTFVDSFIYDTRKDSDRGAWRDNCSTLPWYLETLNTSTRGATREFPEIVQITVETGYVTIYDATNQNLPMWMVFEGYTTTGMIRNSHSTARMVQGVLAVGMDGSSGQNGMTVISFLKDTAILYFDGDQRVFTGGIADRNSHSEGWSTATGDPGIIEDTINHVKMTVLPSAPVDADTGIQVPTIAVATDGGVSIVDGLAGVDTVVDITGFTQDNTWVDLVGDNLWTRGDNIEHIDRFTPIPSVDILSSAKTVTYSPGTTPATNPTVTAPICSVDVGVFGRAFGFADMLTLLKENLTTLAEGMVAYVTSSYFSGWMPGDIKLATLADSVAGDSELMTNGSFTTDSDWTKNGSWTISGDEAHSVVNNGSIYQEVSDLVVGVNYKFSYEITSVSVGNVRSFAGTITGDINSTVDTYIEYFEADADIMDIGLETGGFTGSVDNFSVVLAQVEDRSVNDNPLVVVGTITKTAVATNTDLIAYSGFSADDYIEQPYNADLDFGTGTFYGMWWENVTTTGIGTIMAKRPDASTGLGFINSTNRQCQIGNTGYNSGVAPIINTWVFVCWYRDASNSLKLLVNGEVAYETTSALDADATEPLCVGSVSGGSNPLSGSLALLRLGAGVPSDEKIAEIYNSERMLFEAGATFKLPSSSVTALDFDYDKQILAVGTDSGYAEYLGLTKIDTVGVTGQTSSDYSSVSRDRGSRSITTAAEAGFISPSRDVPTKDIWANQEFTTAVSVTQRVGSNSLWIVLAESILFPVELSVTLSGAPTTLYAGVMTANVAVNYNNPNYGAGESRKDFSISDENSNGSRYYKKRDIVRTFNLTAEMPRAEAQQLIDSYDTLGEEPSAWRLTDLTSSNWVVFARFAGPPAISHDHPEDSIISWSLIEVL